MQIERMIKLKIGARTFKTAFAILVALVIAPTVGLEGSADMATTAVIFSMMPSVQETFKKTYNRIIANIIGGVIAFLVFTFLGDSNVMIALASTLLIALLHQIKLDDAIGLATLTVINVMLDPGPDIFHTAFIRVSATLLGVIIAFFVNTFVFPPKYDVRFYDTTIHLTDESMKYVRAMMRKNAQYPIMREDLTLIKKELNKLKVYYSYMMDPIYKRLFSSHYYSTLRFLAVSRQSIKTNEIL